MNSADKVELVGREGERLEFSFAELELAAAAAERYPAGHSGAWAVDYDGEDMELSEATDAVFL